MGAKDSKPSFISYEDAAKRVSDSELRRIREAFKRCAGANGSTLSLEAFIHEVLCDGVPTEVAEWLYQACGGTKRGITFKDLLCGVVVLTKGNIEEKIKFLWTLYVNNQNENGTYIYKRDFAKALQLENTSLPISESYRTIEILTSLFGNGEKVTFDQFRSWLLIHKDATVLSKWLLFDRSNNIQDLETPTFYQSLAGVTHLEERDIIELEKYFWSLRNSAVNGELDATSMRSLLSPPLPRAAVEGTFLAFDENRDGHIDFKELCCGLSAACRGPTTERLKFCFKIFDLDRDGILNKKELVDMVDILCTVANEAIKNQGSRSSSPDGDSDGGKGFDPEAILMNLRDKLVTVQKDGRKPVFHLGPNNGEDMVILSEERDKTEDPSQPSLALRSEEFLIWAVETAEGLVAPFLELVFDVCHVVLGLRPQCKHRERDIVMGWVRRETCRGLAVGQFWYLVSAHWWSAWLLHASAPPHYCCRPRPHPNDDLLLGDDSFTTNSTESMGSLLWRAESVSLGSAGGSSGVGSTRRTGAPHPGPVDNSRLVALGGANGGTAVRTLTGEGGHLRRDVTLAQHRDFELLPDALWRALALWYGAPAPLPRQVIRPPNSDVELELYPLQLKILRHVPNTQRITTTFSSLGAAGAGAGAVAAGAGGGALYAPAPPERQLAYTAAFSRLATVKQVTEFLCNALGLTREDVRLWALGGAVIGGDGTNSGALLLDDERPTLTALHLDERTKLLLEIRNPDLTWPEEIGALGGALGSGGSGAASRWAERRETLTAPQLPGATGLHNLGNTCYMNAALQSVWNTGPLAQYFNSGMHLYEVNASNPLGTKGALAMRFGELCKEVWTSGARSVAPLRVRWCVTRHARALAGGGQHDAQELLAWLLDALHEDLNRAAPARPASSSPPLPALPSPPPPAPARRPDRELAAEAWAAHAARNDSILTELFYGQLKSKVRCSACGRESVRFDTFNMLSLPLPMESYVRYTVNVILQDGSVPVKYGVRVNSEGTYLDLKKNLSELCGLAAESMVLVVVTDSLIARWLSDGDKVSGAATDLHAYELPRPGLEEDDSEDSGGSGDDVRVRYDLTLSTEDTADLEETDSGVTEGSADGLASDAEGDLDCEAAGGGGAVAGGEGGAGAARGSVSVARSSLCMPALFCFKQQRPILQRSRSEMLMPPPSPSPARPPAALASCPGRMDRLGAAPLPLPEHDYFVAVHRKQVGGDAYFVPWQRARAALFGEPLLVGAPRGATGRRLYAAAWRQLARLLSPAAATPANHARDCDDSLAYSFPFTLRLVAAPGARWCALCAWPALCRGCALPADDAPLLGGATRASGGVLRQLRAARGALLAIDWEPPALHLRYQWARARARTEHGSVGASAVAAARPVDLASCLRAFTQEERLEQRYRCAACKGAQPATKKLQIWRLPPVLVIHLKRFQYVNNKWIKSHKVVNFPYEDFDPTPYLASVPQETILLHKEIKATRRKSTMFIDVNTTISENESDHDDQNDHGDDDDIHETTDSIEANERRKSRERARRESGVKARQRLESTSLTHTPVTDDNLVDYHQHHLVADEDPFDLKYNLYAVVSHTGQLSGGHYVAYTRHPSGAWLCYNDSSCRALPPPAPPALDAAAAYLLFYERRGLRDAAYLPRPPPNAARRPPPALDEDDDLRKMCSVV